MKIPKKMRMFGYDWTIEKLKDKEGGAFNWTNKKIQVGYKFGEQEVVFLHEIIEAVLTNRLHRYYTNEANNPFLFSFNHTEFCNVIYDLYTILKDNKII